MRITVGKVIANILFSIVASLFAFSCIASTQLNSDSYELYVGDVDGDSYDDYYFKAKQKIVLIGVDISIPVLYQDADSMLISGFDNEGWDIKPWNLSVDVSQLEVGEFKFLVGDFNGDGKQDLLGQSLNARYSSFIAYGSSSGAPSEALIFTTITGQEVYGTTLVLKDINNDGRTDILIQTKDGHSVQALAGTTGGFQIGEFPNTGLTMVGATAGDFEVGSDGAATYTIPIAMPRGGAGMQPDVSLNYHSSAGNGVMGIGWDISATSTIARCGKTYHKDGVSKVVTFTEDDRFCMGGMRLVAIDGSYGKDGTEYRTEQDSAARIRSYGAGDDNGPAYFKVEYKSGEIAYFGDLDGSLKGYDNATGAYYLVKIQDRSTNGNARTYQYQELAQTGEFYLTNIFYPGGEVAFNYQSDRSDYTKAWLSGRVSSYGKYLSSIETKAAGQRYRSYHFGYQTDVDNNRLYLQQVTECGFDGACLKPSLVSYVPFASGFEQRDTGLRTDNFLFSADIDGDGNSDFVGAINGRWYVNKSDGISFDKTLQLIADFTTDTKGHSFPIDVDGDGASEVLIPANNVWNVLRVKKTNGQHELEVVPLTASNQGYQYNVQVADINGDGLQDLYIATNNHWQYRLNIGGDFGELVSTGIHNEGWEYTQAIDIDGDGITELLIPRDYKWNVLTQDSGAFVLKSLGVNNVGYQYGPKIMDINGDGQSDLLLAYDHTWHFYLNIGGEFKQEVYDTGINNAGWELAKVGDFDSDGFDDLIYPSGGTLKVLKSRGDSFIVQDTGLGESYKGDNKFFVLDNNSDGVLDIIKSGQAYTKDDYCYYDSFVSYCRKAGTPYDTKLIYSNKNRFKGLIAEVKNGLGLKSSFYYSTLNGQAKTNTEDDGISRRFPLVSKGWDTDAYQDSGDDLASMFLGMPVVDKVVVSDDINKREKFYSYYGHRYHKHLGSVGFSHFTVSEYKGFSSTNVFSQNWALKQQKMIVKSLSYIDHAGFFSSPQKSTEARYTYDTGFLEGSDQKIYTVNVSKKVDKQWSMNSGILGVLESVYSNSDLSSETTTTTLYTPDYASAENTYPITAVGNMLGVSVVSQDKDGHTYSTVTTSEYEQEDQDQWIVGRITRSQVSHTGTNRDAVTKTSEWVYDAKGFLEKEIVEPDNHELSVETTYSYNSRGLVDTKSTSVSDALTRTNRTVYDSLGRYVEATYNALNQRVSYARHHPILGLVTEITDINGLTSYSGYDGFGRVIMTSSPNGQSSSTRYAYDSLVSSVQYKYQAGGSENELKASYFRETKNQNGVWSREYFDRFGRVIEKRSLNSDGQAVAVRTEYDYLGREHRQSEPFYATSAPEYWTTTQYDAMSRPVKVVDPKGYQHLFTYEKRTVTITNNKSQTKKETRSADGKLIEVEDALGNKVTYTYDAIGNMRSMTDEGGQLTTLIEYDGLGRKKSMSDPDKGFWSYEYNGFGELVLQTDANGTKVCTAYDALGRSVLRVDEYIGDLTSAKSGCLGSHAVSQVTHWYYDTATYGKGLLHKVEGPNGYSQLVTYDSLSRVKTTTQTIDGDIFKASVEYDGFGRPYKQTSPGGLVTYNHYNTLGFLTEIRQADNKTYYWKVDQVNVRGNVTAAYLANSAIHQANAYESETGLVTDIRATTVANLMELQDFHVEYDSLGNIESREDRLQNIKETAHYDDLNRLLKVDLTRNGETTSTPDMGYESNGNIRSKWGVEGDYQYGAYSETSACDGIVPGPHAVTEANAHVYCYDNNGNMISGAGRTIQWASFGKPVRIDRAGNSVQFVYGPGRNRIKRIDTTSENKVTVTTYVGNYEKVSKPNGVVEERHYVGGVAVITKTTSGMTTKQTESYMLKDNLGSVIAYVDVARLLQLAPDAVSRSSFDAWGKRRQSDWQDMSLNNLYSHISPVSERGFTGHEQIDSMGLIHMNGRVYDPILGRFISADPFIQDPSDLQSLNRYAYVRNNPLSITDPTGFFWNIGEHFKKGGWKEYLYTVFSGGVYAGVKLHGRALREFGRFARKNKYVAEITQIVGCALAGPMGCAVVTSMVTYGVTDGDFKAAFKAGAIAFVQAGVSLGIGDAFGSPDIFTLDAAKSIGAHALLGGAISSAQGGKFATGALAAGFGKTVTLGLSSADIYGENSWLGQPKDGNFLKMAGRTTIAALAGGTGSALSGGSFANGAVTAAMQHLFNSEGILGGVDKARGVLAKIGEVDSIADLIDANNAALDSIYNMDMAQLSELHPGVSSLPLGMAREIVGLDFYRRVTVPIQMYTALQGVKMGGGIYFDIATAGAPRMIGSIFEAAGAAYSLELNPPEDRISKYLNK